MARLDQTLVTRGLVRSRSEAAELISQGRVTVDGAVARKPALQVGAEMPLEIVAGPRFVGRGGFKLAAALDAFGIDVAGKTCLDIGSSTGGFTDCLLQRGAAKVVAVDVGTDQLDVALRQDPRVDLHEGTDIRKFKAADLERRFALVVVDASFISICDLSPTIAALTSSAGLILVKPQFEVGRKRAGRGVVTKAEDRARAVAQAQRCLAAVGLDTVGSMDSPLPGEHGNREVWVLVEA